MCEKSPKSQWLQHIDNKTERVAEYEEEHDEDQAEIDFLGTLPNLSYLTAPSG